MTPNNFDLLFQRAVSHSFSTLRKEELKNIALNIWYENVTPDTSHFNTLQKQKAGYLLDRLMRYNCVSKQRKLELLLLVNTLKDSCELKPSLEPNNAEPLALSWGLTEDIAQLASDLLQYQTRHYVLNHTQ